MIFMIRQNPLFVILLAICIFLLSACAQLPEYARPTFYSDPDSSSADDPGFSYRILSIDDFEAETLPPDYQQYHGFINARSCLNIRPSNATQARISQTSYYGSQLYVGHFTNISFEARFIPSCSWWNPNTPKQRVPYVLQHEQIHFAIGELTARKVTEELREKMNDYTALGGSQSEVGETLMKTLVDSAHEIIESELDTHTEFDEDTSMFVDKDRQNSWFVKVNALLDGENSPE